MTDVIRLEIDNTKTNIKNRVRTDGSEPPGGGMEFRVQSLEDNVKEIRNDMKDVRERLIKLEVKVDHLPSKGFVAICLGVMLSLITALIGFQDRIQDFLK